MSAAQGQKRSNSADDGQRGTASNLVMDRIQEMVAEGLYASGDRLPSERQLSQAFGVSRTALREGLGRLVAGGLLEIRRSSGIYIAELNLDEIFAVRLVLEPFAASLAAGNRSQADAACLGDMGRVLRDSFADPRQFAAADAAIHAKIAAVSGNRVLAGSLQRLSRLSAVSRLRTSPSLGVRGATLRDMNEVIAAVGAGDSARAAVAMKRHLGAVHEISTRSGASQADLQRGAASGDHA